MPTLPEDPEPVEGPAARARAVVQRAGAVMGADSWVVVWAALLFVVIVVCLSLAPSPWAQVGLGATFLLALVLLRVRSRPRAW